MGNVFSREENAGQLWVLFGDEGEICGLDIFEDIHIKRNTVFGSPTCPRRLLNERCWFNVPPIMPSNEVVISILTKRLMVSNLSISALS